jgi:caa(3)-type oxidase subunit IV
VAGAALTIGVSFAGLGDISIVIHMLISAVQVSLVAYYWMHLQRADSVTWLVSLSSLFIMIILFALPLGDYMTRHLGGL